MDFSGNLRATLLYFDYFDYPLTADELFRFHPDAMEREEFSMKLAESGIQAHEGLFQLERETDLAQVRKRREREAKRMLLASRAVGLLIGYFPFVRGAFMSGSLSKGVNDGDADIDLFIVSAEQRLWVCRSIITMFKKLFLLGSKKFLCPNYFVTEKHLQIPEKNIFTATEIVTLKPLYNHDMLQRLFDSNSWVSAFYPNFVSDLSKRAIRKSIVQRALEFPMSDGYTAKFDERLMDYYRRVWKERYPQFEDAEREFLFRTTPYSSKVHPHDYQSLVLDTYERRLKHENLQRLTRLDG